MMSHDNYSENSAINLSTSQVSRGSNSAANGNGDSEDSQSSVRKFCFTVYFLHIYASSTNETVLHHSEKFFIFFGIPIYFLFR